MLFLLQQKLQKAKSTRAIFKDSRNIFLSAEETATISNAPKSSHKNLFLLTITQNIDKSTSGFRSSVTPSILPSYLLQLSAPGSHEHHRVLPVRVGRHSAHALGAVLVQRVSLDDPQASDRLVQHQAAEIVSDLLRLWKQKKEKMLLIKVMKYGV